MTSIVDFIEARLAEDEEAARAVADDSWLEDVLDEESWNEWHEGVKEHVTLHGPARVLREVEAKRNLLEEYKSALGAVYVGDRPWEHVPTSDVLKEFVISMAAVYSDHPDYNT